MYIIIGIIAAVSLIVIRLTNSSMVSNINQLQNIDDFFEEVSNIEDVEFIDEYKETAAWAESNGFELDIFALLHSNSSSPTKCVSWWSAQHRTYLLFYLSENGEIIRKAADFYTHLEQQTSLTTCSTIDGLLFPKLKKDLIQCKADASLDEQFRHHVMSLVSIKQNKKLTMALKKPDLFAEMRKSIKEQADYLVSLPLWKHRGFYWFFVRRHLVKYRTY